MKAFARYAVLVWVSVVVLLCVAGGARAETPAPAAPPAAAPRPDDAPFFRIGAVLFADYTYTQSPEATDTDGNSYHPNQFNVGRSYINVTGTLNHLVNVRFTPDIARETGAGSALNGSLTFRVKHAFGQVEPRRPITSARISRSGSGSPCMRS